MGILPISGTGHYLVMTTFYLDRSCMTGGGMHPGVLRLALEALEY